MRRFDGLRCCAWLIYRALVSCSPTTGTMRTSRQCSTPMISRGSLALDWSTWRPACGEPLRVRLFREGGGAPAHANEVG